jgi:ADP-ribose pyrophosphatase YjhB (NUDIX family)
VPPYRGWWDIPGGFLEENEHPERGAAREVREETGLRVRIGDLRAVLMDRYGDQWTLNLYYAARPVGGTPRASDDAAALRWFGPRELPRRIAFPRHARRAVLLWRRSLTPGRHRGGRPGPTGGG